MKNKKNAFVWFCAIGITFLLAGVWGCDKADSVVYDPQAAIIGTWMLVAEGPDEDRITPVTYPYFNIYFSDGEFQRFHDSTNAYEEYRFTYQIDSTFIYQYSPIGNNGRAYKYSFINKNKLKLT
jgi:hypothetical protein